MDRKQLILARQLREAGCPLLPEKALTDASSQGLLIKQLGYIETRLFDLDCGGTGCMIDLEITNERPREIVIADFELRLPWKELNLRWPDDPALQAGGNVYRFPGNSAPDFPHNVVINHRVLENGKLSRGKFLIGFLLGLSYDSLPAHLVHGERIDLSFSVIDIGETPYSTDISVWIDRTEKLELKPARKTTWQPLFTAEDLSAESDCSPEASELLSSKG